MAFADRFNTTKMRYNYSYPEEANYVNLGELYESEKKHGTVYRVLAVYINTKGRYGDQGCLAIDGSTIVNLPQHLLEDCKAIREDPEATERINTGEFGFRIETYQRAGEKNKHYTVRWVDIAPDTPF